MKYLAIRRWMLIALSLAGVAATVYLADYLLQLQKNKGLVPPGKESSIGGPFSLVDQTGQAVTERNFANRHKLIFFGFSNCPDVCPTTLKHVSAILQHLGPVTDRLYPLFITVDPERDTPERLREYAKAFDPRIVYLTGSPQKVEQAITAWRATWAKIAVGDHDYSIEHSAVLYLMTPDGKLLRSYDGNQIPEDIEHSIREYLNP